MLLSLACALQLAAAAHLSPITVRVGDRARTVPTVRNTQSVVALRADLLAEALGGQLLSLGGGEFRFVLATQSITFITGSPWFDTDSGQVPLVTAPYRVEGRVFLPLASVEEVLPRVFSGLLFDEDKQELRRFAMVSTRGVGGAPTIVAAVRKASVSPGVGTTGASSSASRPAPKRSEAPGVRRRVVVVDAGHGGPDNGMSGPIGVAKKIREKNITLAIALQVQRALEEHGVTVVMTRTRDTLIALHDRGKIANTAKGDLFISVHVNAANPNWNKPSSARGYETYFLAEAKTEDEKRVEAMENESIRFETSAETSADDPLGFIIRDMAQNEHLRESLLLATLVQGQLKEIHPGPSRGIKQAGFSVLVRAFMPAVLVEVGFGSNPTESAYMTNPAKQKELGIAIADAAVAYLLQYEKKVGSGSP